MISIDIQEKPDSKWNDRLLTSNQGTIYQTADYANFLSSVDYEPIFMKFFNKKGNEIAQLLLTKILRVKLKKYSAILKKIPRKKNFVLKWTYGPVFFDESFSQQVYESLTDYLKSRKWFVNGKTHPFSPSLPKNLDESEIINWCTFIIDLKKKKDKIFEKIDKHSGRKNIARSLKRGVKIEEINENNMKEYAELVNKKLMLLKSKPVSLKKNLAYWKAMKPLGYNGFIAKKDGEPISSIFFYSFNNYLIESGIAISEKDKEEKLYTQDLLKWRIIEWGIDHKMSWFDLAGANPNPQNKKEEGILRYKRKWGGDLYNYYIIKNPNSLYKK